jgi:hypothetical protein
MRQIRRTRAGFTLVELLVAAALSMVIMLIIGFAMQKCIESFRTMRAVSQLQERLKSVHLALKRDMESEHFVPSTAPNGASFSGVKLSQQRLDLAIWQPPNEGFFSIMQGQSVGGDPLNPGPWPSIFEGRDSDGLPSTRAVTHSLHFTARLIPDPAISTIAREEDYFYATVAPGSALANPPITSADFTRPFPGNNASNNIFASRWAEVMYFLVPKGANANGEPLFALYRRQRLLAPQGSASVPWNVALESAYPNVSWSVPSARVNTTTDIPVRANRMPGGFSPQPSSFDNTGNYVYGYGNIWRAFAYDEIPTINSVWGDDILVTDVLSFEIKANWSITDSATNATGASQAWESMSGVGVNQDWPYDYLPTLANANPRNTQYNDSTGPYPARTFDTWSATDAANANPAIASPPLRIRIQSLQFRLRVWDQNTQTARQITIVQDM